MILKKHSIFAKKPVFPAFTLSRSRAVPEQKPGNSGTALPKKKQASAPGN